MGKRESLLWTRGRAQGALPGWGLGNLLWGWGNPASPQLEGLFPSRRRGQAGDCQGFGECAGQLIKDEPYLAIFVYLQQQPGRHGLLHPSYWDRLLHGYGSGMGLAAFPVSKANVSSLAYRFSVRSLEKLGEIELMQAWGFLTVYT